MVKQIFLAFSILFLGVLSSAFTLNSPTDSNLQGWPDPNVNFVVNATNCPAGFDVAGLINAAGAVWNNVAASRVKVSYGGTTTNSSPTAPPITVYCENNFQTVTGMDQNAVPAAAAVGTGGGRVQIAIIYLNTSGGSANISNYDPEKLKIVMAHEIGHSLGLGHSEDSHALMYWNATARTKLSLSQDDIDGITYLYPRNELGGDKPYGCGRVAVTPKPPSGGMIIAILFMLLPLFGAATLKRRLRSGKLT